MTNYSVTQFIEKINSSSADHVAIAAPDVRDVPDELRIVDEEFYTYIDIAKEDESAPKVPPNLVTIAQRFGISAVSTDVFNILTTYYSYCVDSQENQGLGLDEQAAVTKAIAFAIKCQEALKFEKKLLDLQAQVHEYSQRKHDVNDLRQQLNTSDELTEQAGYEADKLHSEVKELTLQLTALKNEFVKKEKLLAKLQQDLTEKSSMIDGLRKGVAAGEKSQAELNEAQSELSGLRETIKENENAFLLEKAEFERKLSHLQQQLQDAAVLNEELVGARQIAKETSEQLSGELDQSRQEIVDLKRSATDAADELAQAQANNRSLESRNAELTLELENLRSQLSAVREPQDASMDLASELAMVESVSSQPHSSVKSEGVAVNYQAIIEKLEAVSKNKIASAQNIKGVASGILPFVKAANKLQIQNRDQRLDLAGLRAIFAAANLSQDSATSIFDKLTFDNKEAIKGFLQGDGKKVPQDLELLNKRPQQVAELLSSLSTAAIAVAADKSREFAGDQLQASNHVVAVAVAAENMSAQLRYLQRESEIESLIKEALDEQERLHQERVDELERQQAVKLAALENDKEVLVEQLKALQSERDSLKRPEMNSVAVNADSVSDSGNESAPGGEDSKRRRGGSLRDSNHQLRNRLKELQSEMDRLTSANAEQERLRQEAEEKARSAEERATEQERLKREAEERARSLEEQAKLGSQRADALNDENIALNQALEELKLKLRQLNEEFTNQQQALDGATLANELQATELKELQAAITKKEREVRTLNALLDGRDIDAALKEELIEKLQVQVIDLSQARDKAMADRLREQGRADEAEEQARRLERQRAEIVSRYKAEIARLRAKGGNATSQDELRQILEMLNIKFEAKDGELERLQADLAEGKNEIDILNTLLDGRDIDAALKEELIAQLTADLNKSQTASQGLRDESDVTRQRIADLEAQLATRDSGQLVVYNPDGGKGGPTFTFNVPPRLFNLLSDQAVMDALTKENQELRDLVARLLSKANVATATEEDGVMTPFEFKVSPQDIKNFLLLLTQIREVQVPSVTVEGVTEIEDLKEQLERLKAQVERERDDALTEERAKAGAVTELQKRLSSINERFFDQTLRYDEEARLKEEAQKRAELAEHRNQGLVAENADLRARLADLQAQLAAAQEEKRQVKVATTEVGVGTDSDPSMSLLFGKDSSADVYHGQVPRTNVRAVSTSALQAETVLEQQVTDFYEAIVAMTKKINARDIRNLEASGDDVFSAVSSVDTRSKSVLDYSLTANPNAQYQFGQQAGKDAKIKLMTNRFERAKLNSLLKIFTGKDINGDDPPDYLQKGCAEGENPFAKNAANNIAVIAFAKQLGAFDGDIPNVNNNTEEEISSLFEGAQRALNEKFPDISVALKEVASKFYPRAQDHKRDFGVTVVRGEKPSSAVSIINADKIHNKLQQAQSEHYGSSSRA